MLIRVWLRAMAQHYPTHPYWEGLQELCRVARHRIGSNYVWSRVMVIFTFNLLRPYVIQDLSIPPTIRFAHADKVSVLLDLPPFSGKLNCYLYMYFKLVITRPINSSFSASHGTPVYIRLAVENSRAFVVPAAPYLWKSGRPLSPNWDYSYGCLWVLQVMFSNRYIKVKWPSSWSWTLILGRENHFGLDILFQPTLF